MALLEVVLLAGPAFAVGARRQQRVPRAGRRDRRRRRATSAGSCWPAASCSARRPLWSAPSLGIGVAWLARAVRATGQQPSRSGRSRSRCATSSRSRPCGLLSALLAALAPAVMAARQDVVAVLAGRRGETTRPRWSPVARGGAARLRRAGCGGRRSTHRHRRGDHRRLGHPRRARHGAARPARGLAARSRLGPAAPAVAVRRRATPPGSAGRTAPAVAAVGAVVAGVVALGIGAASDNAANRATYEPRAPLGVGVVTSYTPPQKGQDPWARLDAERHRAAARCPAASRARPAGRRAVALGPGPAATAHPGSGRPSRPVTASYSDWLGSALLVGRPGSRALGLHLPAADLARAEAVLARGGVVMLGQAPGRRARGDGHRRGVRPDGAPGTVRRPALAGPGDPARRPRHHPPGAGRGVPRGRPPHAGSRSSPPACWSAA